MGETVTKIQPIPSISGLSPEIQAFAAPVKQAIEVLLGRTGDPLDAAVTFRRAGGSTVVGGKVVTIGGGGSGSGGTVVIGGGSGGTGAYVPDLTPPPTASGLVATPGFSTIFLEWDDFGYSSGHGHAHTEVWRATDDLLGNAILIGTAPGTIYVDSVGSGAGPYFYWIRFVSRDGVKGNYNAASGVEGSTSPDPAYIRGLLAGALTEDALATEVINGKDAFVFETKTFAIRYGSTGYVPFIVQATPTTINGRVIPPGVYMDEAFMSRFVAQAGQIGSLAVDDAAIANLSALKLTAGDGTIGGRLKSAFFVSGVAGWQIHPDGTAEFNNILARGTIQGESGYFKGNIIGGNATSMGSGIGFWAGRNASLIYQARLGDPEGSAMWWDGENLLITDSDGNVILASGSGVSWDKIFNRPADGELMNSKATTNNNLLRGLVNWTLNGTLSVTDGAPQAEDGHLLQIPSGQNYVYALSQTVSLAAGQSYVISFKAWQFPGSGRRLHVDLDDGSIPGGEFVLSSSQEPFSFTWTQAAAASVKIRVYAEAQAATAYVANIKLEVGTKPTLWTPFVGDVVSTSNPINDSNKSGFGYLGDLNATHGAPAGTQVAGVAAEDIVDAVTNYNSGNDRDGSPIAPVTIASDGTAVDHVEQTDGSVDISLEWGWTGDPESIDGFMIYVYQSSAPSAYTFGLAPSAEMVFSVPVANKAFILYGVAADKYYTFGVRAYRAVGKDIHPDGLIVSPLVKPAAAEESPYRPKITVSFAGTVTGSVGSIPASAVNVWSSVTGAGKPSDYATVGARIGSNLLKGDGGYAFAEDFVATWNRITSANISTYMSSAAIGTAQIQHAAITQALIASAAVGTAQIQNASINSAHIQDLSVGAAKIQDLSVGGKKMAPPVSGAIYVQGGYFGGVWHGIGRNVLISIVKVEVNSWAVPDPPGSVGYSRKLRGSAVLEGMYSNYFDLRNTSEVDFYNAFGTFVGSSPAPATIYYVYM